MARLALAVLALTLTASCSEPPPVKVPATPEAQSCVRDCMAVDNMCRAGRLTIARAYGCDHQWHDCLMTCPGAHE